MRKIVILLIAILISGCLPDDSERIRRINQRAVIENTARDLATSAMNLSSYLSATKMKRRALLDSDGQVVSDDANDFTVTNLQVPVPPSAITASPCGDYGAIAYYHALPSGIGSLLMHGNAMAASLVPTFGHDAVGMKSGYWIQLPKKAVELGCTVGNDILDGSPIFVAGFALTDGMNGLPDPSKTTEPVFDRVITMPCPAGTNGVIKRDQTCRLKSKDDETVKEDGFIIINDAPNERQRLTKNWECTPDLSQPQTPPTTEEIAVYCRDPANDITKIPDNAVAMQMVNLKEALENNGPGYYTFFCRPNKDGSNACEAKPYSPEPRTFLDCGRVEPNPPRFVINPVEPLQMNENGDLIGNEQEIRECGRGWRGRLTARYLARRCTLKRNDGYNSTTIISTPQTIYRIGYAQAQCERDIETTVACPDPSLVPGSDPNKRLWVVRHARMLKPVALDWSENKPGPAAWDTTRIATTDSRTEVRETAAMSAPNKPPAVIPATTRAELDSISDSRVWSEKLVDAMRQADPSSIEAPIVSCNNNGNPCGIPTPQTGIEVWAESDRLWPYTGDGNFTMVNLTCSVARHKRCNPILGEDQANCREGVCSQDQNEPLLYIGEGGRFDQLVNSYFSYVETPLPPGNAILRVAPSTSVPLFNDANAICNIASTDFSRLMIFGTYNEEYASFDGVRQCAALGNKPYTDSRDMLDDAVDVYLAKGGELVIFTDHIKMGNEGKPVYHLLNTNIFSESGLVTTTLQSWLRNAPSAGNPCTVIPQE
ncbi:hypothetical protein [Emticicia fluvialis]|uniref:hypothetical protein n=1 Tax=Emticicia fluvialis TaxID=2974474 RepID=UPI002165D6A4|nr:hypothetical protein [Emticicia fluvialis]